MEGLCCLLVTDLRYLLYLLIDEYRFSFRSLDDLLKLRDVGYEGMSRLMFKQHIICEHSSQMMVFEYFKIVIILKI